MGDMTLLRAEIITHPRASDPPKDWTVNTMHFTNSDTSVGRGQALADQVSAMWRHGSISGGWGPFDNRNHTIKVYDLSDPKPRPIVGLTNYTASFPTGGDIEQRQGALCLSYYSIQNLPRRRGRLFIGPFDPDFSGTQERPSDNALAKILDLGNQIQTMCSTDGKLEHVIVSQFEPSIHIISDYWVNDVWDVIRSRAPKETKRVKLHF